MKFIYTSIGIMLLLMFVGQAYNTSLVITPLDSIYSVGNGTYTITNQTGTYLINGTDTSMTIGENNLILGISLTDGIMLTGIALGALMTVVGISVLGSNLSEYAQKGIINLALFGAFWVVFSVLTYQLVSDLAIFGWFIFFIISLIHFLGIFQLINGESS